MSHFYLNRDSTFSKNKFCIDFQFVTDELALLSLDTELVED